MFITSLTLQLITARRRVRHYLKKFLPLGNLQTHHETGIRIDPRAKQLHLLDRPQPNTMVPGLTPLPRCQISIPLIGMHPPDVRESLAKAGLFETCVLQKRESRYRVAAKISPELAHIETLISITGHLLYPAGVFPAPAVRSKMRHHGAGSTITSGWFFRKKYNTFWLVPEPESSR